MHKCTPGYVMLTIVFIQRRKASFLNLTKNTYQTHLHVVPQDQSSAQLGKSELWKTPSSGDAETIR